MPASLLGVHRWFIGALTVFMLSPGLSAQEVVDISLSLEEAIAIARQNNPGFQATRNDEVTADWDVKSAYGALLPSATSGGAIRWQGPGEQQFGSITAQELGFPNQPSFWSSSYSIGLSYNVSGSVLLAPGQAKARRRATRAQVANAGAILVFRVTQQYIAVLRQAEQVKVSEQQLERTAFNLRLAQAQYEVGTASAVEVAQAEVGAGRAEVTVLLDQNQQETARIRLLQLMGVDLDQPVVLTTPFRLAEPLWSRDELYELGLDGNPNLHALRENHRASEFGVKIAKSAYLPSLSLSTSFSGFSQQATSTDFRVASAEARSIVSINNCLFQNDLFSRLADPLPATDCSRLAFSDADAQAIRDANNVFPFNFTRSPPSATLQISLPIFQGFSRQRQVEAAQVQRENLRHNLREQELALRADIATGLATLRTAYRSALLEERNQATADEQLRLARERFTVGLADFVELLDAESVKAEADRASIAAIFAYHDALASLESAVGQSLRGNDAAN